MTETLPQQYLGQQTDIWVLPIMMMAFFYLLIPLMFWLVMMRVVLSVIPNKEKK